MNPKVILCSLLLPITIPIWLIVGTLVMFGMFVLFFVCETIEGSGLRLPEWGRTDR